MVEKFFIDKDKFIFVSSMNESLFFSLNDDNKLKKINSILENSLEVVVTFPICLDYIKRFNLLYDIILNKNFNIVIDLSLVEDKVIKSNYKLLKSLEDRTGCRFYYKYNTYATANIEEILDAIEFVEKQAEIVKYYNFSPIEGLMFIFDMVRDRQYLEEGKEEGIEVSRDLSKVITNSKIVCAGFANMFSAIANKVGIYTENLYWKNCDIYSRGHVSNISYVNDSIYDIHKIIEIDVTKGCNRNKDNRCFLNYSSFGNSILDVEDFNIGNDLLCNGNDSNLFYRVLQQYSKYVDNFDKGSRIMVNFKAINFINRLREYFEIVGLDMGRCLEIERLIKNRTSKDVIREKIDCLIDSEIVKNSFFGEKLDCYDLISILYMVRRVEHSIDKDKYVFSIDELFRIVNSYSDIKLDKNEYCVRLLINLIYSGIIDEFNLNMVKEDIMRMRVLSTLKKIKKYKD